MRLSDITFKYTMHIKYYYYKRYNVNVSRTSSWYTIPRFRIQ